MPEFVRLRRRALSVALTNHNQRGSFHVLNEIDGRAFRIHGGIVINRGAEIWKQPLIDGDLAIITLPVCDAGARKRSPEPIGLRDGPHGHKSAVAPARNSDALLVHGITLRHGIYTGQNIAQITVSEIADVGAREFLTLPVAAARIRKKEKISVGGEQFQR